MPPDGRFRSGPSGGDFAPRPSTGRVRDSDGQARYLPRRRRNGRGGRTLFQKTAPQSPALEWLAGLRDQQHDEFAAAAQHYRAAAERTSDPDERREYLNQVLDAWRGLAAAQGYAADPDPVAALAHLTDGLEFDDAIGTPDDLPRLVALHQRRAPRVRCPIWKAWLLCGPENCRLPKNCFARGMAKAAPPVAGEEADRANFGFRCREKLLETLYRQNRLSAAFPAIDADDASSFRRLAWLCQQEQNWPALDELIRLRRRQQTSDPWIDYFLALRAQANGDSAAALEAVQRAEAGADESLVQTLAWLKNQLLIQSGGVSQAYQGSSDQREAFRRLVTHLAGLEDWDGVLELANLHGSLAPRRSATLYWSVTAHWHRGEYQEIVDILTPWPEDRVSRLEPGQLSELCDLLVRSLLRLGKLAEAEAAADRRPRRICRGTAAGRTRLGQGRRGGHARIAPAAPHCPGGVPAAASPRPRVAPLLSDARVAAIRHSKPRPCRAMAIRTKWQ